MEGMKDWMEEEMNEKQFMFRGKNLFPTSALHLHLKLPVVYLDPLKEDKSGNGFLVLITQVQSIKPLVQEKVLNCTSVNKFKASTVTDFA